MHYSFSMLGQKACSSHVFRLMTVNLWKLCQPASYTVVVLHQGWGHGATEWLPVSASLCSSEMEEFQSSQCSLGRQSLMPLNRASTPSLTITLPVELAKWSDIQWLTITQTSKESLYQQKNDSAKYHKYTRHSAPFPRSSSKLQSKAE